MRVLLVGGTGVIGRSLRRKLLEAGHDVAVMSRSEARASQLERGIQAIVGDVLDRERTARVVAETKPEAILHQATAIPPAINPRRLAKDFALTNRLRTEGTANLIAGARAGGGSRLVAQSIAFAYAPDGPTLATEDTPLNRNAPRQFRPIVEAVAKLEELVVDANGVVLRYGHFYGPDTAYAISGDTGNRVRSGRLPIIGDGGGRFSFVHVDDAADATLIALDLQGPGAFNVVDDDPALAREWIPHLAELYGGRKPWRVPVSLARIAAGAYGVEYMTRLRGASNARAKELLAWHPSYPSWRQGFTTMAHDAGGPCSPRSAGSPALARETSSSTPAEGAPIRFAG